MLRGRKDVITERYTRTAIVEVTTTSSFTVASHSRSAPLACVVSTAPVPSRQNILLSAAADSPAAATAAATRINNLIPPNKTQILSGPPGGMGPMYHQPPP